MKVDRGFSRSVLTMHRERTRVKVTEVVFSLLL